MRNQPIEENLVQQLPRNPNSRKPFSPQAISVVQADWLRCRNAQDCAKRHGISPRTVHNWIKKYNWVEEADKVDLSAQQIVLERATEERVSLIERVQRINDQILERLEESAPNPTLADFREGVKLESSLLSEAPEGPVEINEFADIENTPLYRRNLMMSPEEMAVECETMARRLRESAEIERKRQSLRAS